MSLLHTGIGPDVVTVAIVCTFSGQIVTHVAKHRGKDHRGNQDGVGDGEY